MCLLIQICRVEDVLVEGRVTGSVIHFHLVRSVNVPSSGVISASGLGLALNSSLIQGFYTIYSMEIYSELDFQKIFKNIGVL